jgi:hypothetical protein
MPTTPNFSQPAIFSEVATPTAPDSGYLKVYGNSGVLCSITNSGTAQSYLTSSSAAATYQPLDSDLTSIASTGVDSYGIGLLTKTSGSGVRDYIGAGTSSFDGAYGSLSGVPSTFAPSAHTHGNITNAGAIGSTTGLPIVTTASGVLTAGSFGTTAGTFAAGDDSRITGALSTSTAAATYAVIAAGQPISGTVGQVLTKNSGANYDSSWSSLVLGDRYLSTSTTSNAVTNGTKTFTIGTGLAYTPTQNITIAYDATHHMHGQVTTYNSGTGVLVVDINNHTGTGTYTSWVVNVGGVTPVTVVSWGDIIGTLGTQSDLSTALNAKLEITTAASTYLPLAGGTLTGPITGTSNTVQFRSSTTAQLVEVFNTYTSATSLEAFRIKAVAGAAYQIGSAIGSAGGTNRDLTFGHYDSAGTFTAGLTINTAGHLVSSYTARLGSDGLLVNGAGYVIGFNGTVFGWTSGSYIGTSSTPEFGWYREAINHARLKTPAGVNGTLTVGSEILTQPVSTSGSPTAFTLTGAAHTTLTASTEATDVNFNLARTVQFATGALTTQRAMRIQAPTYGFVGASTITTASTLSISGPPVAGTNATITSAYALNVESGTSNFGGEIILNSNKLTFGSSSLGGNVGAALVWTSNYTVGFRVLGEGTGRLQFSDSGITLNDSNHIAWTSSDDSAGTKDLYLYRDAAGGLAQRNSTNAQTFSLYNTYTSPTSYERLNIKGKAGGSFEIGPENGESGGTLRGLTIGGYTDGSETIMPWLTFDKDGNATFTTAIIASNISGNLSGSNSGDQDLSEYLTIDDAATTYVPLTRTLNTLALSADQTFAVGTTGTDFAIESSGTAHTFNIPDASDTARGLITTDTQTIAGAKTFSGPIASAKGIYFTSEPTGTPSGTTQTLTLADGNHQTLALTSATGTVTATLTVPTGSSAGSIIVKQHASAAKDIVWAVSAGTIKWMGAEPDWVADAAGSVRIVSWRYDGSVMYLGSTDVAV